MTNIAPTSRSWRMVFAPVALLVIISLPWGGLFARDQAPTAAPESAQAAVSFLRHLEKGEVGPALQLWDAAAGDGTLRARLDRISAKLMKAGGIKKIDVGQCEPRRIKRFEQKLGTKIDVVPLEIICGNESLILAVVSFRKTNDGFRIFQLESLKEWGGTTSLDDDLRYSD